MATVDDISRLLERCATNGLCGKRTDDEMGALSNEWLKALGGFKYELLDKALTEYLANDSGSFVRMPKSGEIKQLCENILEKRRLKAPLDMPGRCPLCGGSGRALVDYPEGFYGNYAGSGIKCPCKRPNLLARLRQGETVTLEDCKKKPDGSREVLGYLEIWLKNERLFGRSRAVGRMKAVERSSAPANKQQSIKPAFEDWPPLEDLPF